MGQIQFLLGVPRSGKTTRCLEAYARELMTQRSNGLAGNSLWLAPAREARQIVLERLLPLTGGVVFQPNVMTFDRFADRVLTETGHDGTAITHADRRLIVRHLIQDCINAKQLDYFQRIAATEGFLDVVVRFIAELKRAEIWPDAFLAAARQRFDSARDAELGLIYDRYQRVLLEKNWYDAEGRFWLARTAMQTAQVQPVSRDAEGLRSGARIQTRSATQNLRVAANQEPTSSGVPFFRELSLVVVDGFSDFTTTQQEMLEQLAVGSQQLLLTLPVEQPLRRTQLFAKPAGVLPQLSRSLSRHGTVKTIVCGDDDEPNSTVSRDATALGSGARIETRSAAQSLCVAANRMPGLRQIHDYLFDNPRDLPRAADSQGLEVVAAVGERAEKVAVALRIKRLLANGVSPQGILIGLRHAEESGPAWDRSLTSAGIPVWCEIAPPWSRSPYLKALFSVLQLEAEKWPFERLNGVLNSSFFRPQRAGIDWQSADSPRRVTSWLRRLKLHSDRTVMLKAIQRRRERVVADETEADRTDLEFAERLLHELSNALEPARKSHDLFGWADALAAITARLGLVSTVRRDAEVSERSARAARSAAETLRVAANREEETRDADWLQGIIRSAAAIEAELSVEPAKRTLAEFVSFLRELIRSESSGNDTPSAGRVRIVGAETLRHLEAKHVFLVEMSEDSFPSRRADDCLYSEVERLQLHGDGLALSHRLLHQQEEMLLFAQAVTRAAEQLTISYSQVNALGHEVYPSPYVTAICELFEPTLSPKSAGSLEPLPNTEELLTARDLRLAAVSQARRKSPGWWKLLLENDSTRPTARNMLAAAEIAHLRYHTQGFTPFEGQLMHSKHLMELAHKYGPTRQFSATELESIAACGFRFWLSNVLKLEPLADPEVVTDYAGRGSLVHDVLAKLADEAFADSAALSQRFRELVKERLDRHVTDDELQQALLSVEQELLDRWAEGYGQQHADYVSKTAESQLTVMRTLTEIPFGAARDADAQTPQDRYPPLILGSGEDAIRIGGRIDRVDVSQRSEQTVFTLIDYKTGKRPEFSVNRVKTGEALQLALYTLAVMKLSIAGPDAIPLWMGYWTVKGAGFAPSGGKRGAAWSPLEGAVLTTLASILAEIVPQLVERIRNGQFVVENADPHCTGHCEFHTVCRVNQIRPIADRLEKHRPPLQVSSTDTES